jgi:hypothetical protein
MDEWTGIAIGAFALSSFVSALRIGHWILNADPRAILNAGRWSLLLIAALTLAVLVWLATNGKWSAALMLAAFILPILVHAAPRWGACCSVRSAHWHEALFQFHPITARASVRLTGFMRPASLIQSLQSDPLRYCRLILSSRATTPARNRAQ